MTAILLNDGEIAAPGLENASRFYGWVKLLPKQQTGFAKLFFPGIQGPGFAHRTAREIHITRGFFAFAKIF